MKCEKCDNRISNDSTFCNKCGKKIKKETRQKKKSNNIIFIILLFAIIFSIAIRLININRIKKEKQEQKEIQIKNDIEDFYESSSLLYLQMFLSNGDLIEIENKISENWYNYIYYGKYKNPNDAIKKALENKKENVENIEYRVNAINEEYKKIQTYPKECKHCDEVKVAAEETYIAYNSYYNTVMNFSGTYDDFSNKSQSTYNDYISKLKNLDTKEQTFKD